MIIASTNIVVSWIGFDFTLIPFLLLLILHFFHLYVFFTFVLCALTTNLGGFLSSIQVPDVEASYRLEQDDAVVGTVLLQLDLILVVFRIHQQRFWWKRGGWAQVLYIGWG